MTKTVKRFAIGTAVAGFAGYLTGLLTAPKSGKETRADIKDTVSRSVAEAEKELKNLHTELGEVLSSAKDSTDKLSDKAQKDLDKLLQKAKDIKETARELLSAVHEGDADDKDLRAAIKDANDAIEHIKGFLIKTPKK